MGLGEGIATGNVGHLLVAICPGAFL
jgi:hypothetical protein